MYSTISYYSKIFGLLFSNITIKRSETESILVPISNSIQQKYNVRNSENPDPDNTPITGTKFARINTNPDRVIFFKILKVWLSYLKTAYLLPPDYSEINPLVLPTHTHRDPLIRRLQR